MDFFTTLDEALESAESNGVPKNEIICLTNAEYEQLFQEEPKIPDELSALTPIQYVRQKTKDHGAEPKRYNNQPKKYDDNLTTSNYIKEYYLRGYESLIDNSISSCPYCQRDWNLIKQELSNAKENLSFQTQNKEFESPDLQIRETHLFYHHVPVAKLLYSLGIIQQFIDVNGNLVPTNPKNVHNLSREQLAQAIQENPELRRKFFRRWVKSLQK